MTLKHYFSGTNRFNDTALASMLRQLYYYSRKIDETVEKRKLQASKLVWLYNVVVNYSARTNIYTDFIASSALAYSKQLCCDGILHPFDLYFDDEMLNSELSDDKIELLQLVCLNEENSAQAFPDSNSAYAVERNGIGTNPVSESGNGKIKGLIAPQDLVISGAFPHYLIPADADKRLAIPFAFAPLIDTMIPLLYKELDPEGWERLARTYALDVSLYATDFHDLFNAVTRAKSDTPNKEVVANVTIASATAVYRAQIPPFPLARPVENPPMAVLPILQKFNAYYLFTKCEHFVSVMNKLKFPATTYLNGITDVSSLHSMYGKTAKFQEGLRLYLDKCNFLIERGADLDFAIGEYWVSSLKGSPGNMPGNLLQLSKGTIAEYFKEFLNSDKPSVYMGGLAQTAYLLNRSGPGKDFLLIAGGVKDFDFVNENILVCEAAFSENHQEEIIRLYHWWFDLLNCFRRDYLFSKDVSTLDNLKTIISRGCVDDDKKLVSIVPEGFDADDMNLLLSFIKIRQPEATGSFLYPNLNDAIEAKHKHIENLKKINAVRAIFSSRSRAQSGGGSGIQRSEIPKDGTA